MPNFYWGTLKLAIHKSKKETCHSTSLPSLATIPEFDSGNHDDPPPPPPQYRVSAPPHAPMAPRILSPAPERCATGEYEKDPSKVFSFVLVALFFLF